MENLNALLAEVPDIVDPPGTPAFLFDREATRIKKCVYCCCRLCLIGLPPSDVSIRWRGGTWSLIHLYPNPTTTANNRSSGPVLLPPTPQARDETKENLEAENDGAAGLGNSIEVKFDDITFHYQGQNPERVRRRLGAWEIGEGWSDGWTGLTGRLLD